MFRGKLTALFACAFVLTGALSVVSSAGVGASADDSSVVGQDGGALVLVLDGSGSMKESAGGGKTRMEAAKGGLLKVIDKLPVDSQVGLRVYGSTITDGAGSCKDSKLLVPVEKTDKSALKSGVDKLKPLGNTPIAYSLEQAAKDLPKKGPRSIVLVSDGQENCGGDPCKVARDLKKVGADFYVDVVGLQVDQKSRDQLTCIASAGGGTYYDVKSLDQLDSTLTRTSIRAARGYEAAGKPIEGGTGKSSAPDLTNGQWLDTIGDSGDEFYTVTDPGKGTFHVSAASPPSASSSTTAEAINVSVLGASGVECGSGASNFVQSLTNGGAPLTASYSVTPSLRKSCGKGPYVVKVDAPEVEGVQALEVLLRTEPAVKTTNGLPSSSGYDNFSDAVKGDAPSSEVVPAVGGPNFSAAPPTVPGTYSDSILVNETLFYRVPDVKWGQQVVCDFTLNKAAAAEAALHGDNYRAIATSRVFGPLKSEISDTSAAKFRNTYGGDSTATVHSASLPVRYLNRESVQTSPRATDLDGDYYCAVTLLSPTSAISDKIGEVPFELTVSVVGSEAGTPDYVSNPDATRTDAPDGSDGGGPGVGVLAGGLAVLAAILAALFLFLKRRRPADDDQ